MKSFQFEGHKLIYHTDRVHTFLTKGDCYPLYMEISPVGNCNHRCIFCAYDYIGYPNRKLKTDRTLGLIDELADLGLKSILFAGEGEPLLHPNIAKLVHRAYQREIDSAIFTNGQLLSEKLARALLPDLTFVRFSFNGGSGDNYARVHSVKAKVFDIVVQNIRKSVEIREKYGLSTDIGAQFVLLPENRDYLLPAVETLKQCGVDYVAVKPFMQRKAQSYQLSDQLSLEVNADLFEAVEKLADETFKVVIRRNTFEEYGVRNYHHCYGTPFISVLNSAGMVSACLTYWERDAFGFGSIYENSFKEIWHSDRRAKVKRHLECQISPQDCPPNCRPNAINEFLWDLQHPEVKHINFI